jgi:hypothetical protein
MSEKRLPRTRTLGRAKRAVHGWREVPNPLFTNRQKLQGETQRGAAQENKKNYRGRQRGAFIPNKKNKKNYGKRLRGLYTVAHARGAHQGPRENKKNYRKRLRGLYIVAHARGAHQGPRENKKNYREITAVIFRLFPNNHRQKRAERLRP